MVDVAIIGGGVCGCSLLYALARYKLTAMLLERTNDVGVGTTKANSAIVHAGYDPEPDTLMARYNVQGNALIRELCAELDILYKPIGSLVVGFSAADRALIEELLARGQKNGVQGLEIIEAERLRQMEPNLSEAARCALYAPSAGVVNPWELAFAQAEVAVKNDANVLLNAEVTAIEKTEGHFTLSTPRGPVEARYVVNCAGIHAGEVAEMAGPAGFTMSTSRGEYFLLDKSEGETVNHVVFQCPGPEGKGVLVAPTVHGNLIVGPNAEAASSLATTAAGLDFVRAQARRSVPDVNLKASIRNFAGLRAQASTGDFVVGPSPAEPRFFNMAGIKSPGLTSAPAIALDVVRMLGEAGLPLEKKENFNNERKILRFSHLNAAQQAAAVAENPLYGRIVCRCGSITEGEIVDALHRPLPPRSVDAVKRRCGPGMGRCQGGFCGPRVQVIIARELELDVSAVPQDREGMDIVCGRTKNESWMRAEAGQPPHSTGGEWSVAAQTKKGGGSHG